MGAIHSHCSWQKNNCEQIASVTHYKRVTMSDSLPLLMTIERREQFTFFHAQIAHSLFCSFTHKKWAICSKNQWANSQPCIFCMLLTVIHCFSLKFIPKSESLLSLIAQSLSFKERQKRFTLIALYKKATGRKSLPSLLIKEWPWTIRSRCSQKTSDWLKKLKREFPTLPI